MSLKNIESNGSGNQPLSEDKKLKIDQVRTLLGQLPPKLSLYCSDPCIRRYLCARNWNVKKATKMLKMTLKWRVEYKPEYIRWDDVAHEAETGKIYRANYFDKHGRSVLVMRPGCQNTNSTVGQIKYLVYCMENAILNLPAAQEQMVWLIDFHGFNMSHISVKVTKETAAVLQDRYPETLGVAILYNPPKFFEPFFTLIRPFLEPKTYRKVKFVYSDDQNSRKIMEDLFNMDELEKAFGGNNPVRFDIADYAARMREDDTKMPSEEISSEPLIAPSSLTVDMESNSDELVKDNKVEILSPKNSQESSMNGNIGDQKANLM